MTSQVAVLLIAATVSLNAEEIEPASRSAEDIVRNLEAADAARRTSFPGYSSIRQYAVNNGLFGMKATMKVQVDVDSRGTKKFHILDVSGPSAVRKLVFNRMLKTEAGASSPEAQAATRISAENYTFRLVEAATVQGKRQYILDVEPKTSNPLLLRGRIWVDDETASVVRIEGSPAKNPSFWVRKTRFVHEYTKVGGLWLAALNTSESDIRIFGKNVVTIQYGEYKLGPAEQAGNRREQD